MISAFELQKNEHVEKKTKIEKKKKGEHRKIKFEGFNFLAIKHKHKEENK